MRNLAQIALTQGERNIVVELHNALRSSVDPPEANMEKMVSRRMNKLMPFINELLSCLIAITHA